MLKGCCRLMSMGGSISRKKSQPDFPQSGSTGKRQDWIMSKSYSWQGTTNELAPRLIGDWDVMNYAIIILVGIMRKVGIDNYSQVYHGFEISITKLAAKQESNNG